jgi:DNA protecting protein DprA
MTKITAKKQPLEGVASAETLSKAANPGRKPAKARAKSATTEQGPIPVVPPAIEDAVGITVDELTALYVLNDLKGFGPQKFKELHLHGIAPPTVVADPSRLPTAGKRGDDLRALLGAEREKSEPTCRRRAATQIIAAHRHAARIVTYKDAQYPINVYESNYPAPILFVRGSLEVLTIPLAVACVGSRKIRAPYSELERAFVRAACAKNFTIVSGFALGADTIGHHQAWQARGKTICVMPGGLHRPFPPENMSLWDSLLQYSGAAFVSEMGFGTRASSLTLRKRNKLIVAFARGVLVAQSATTGGAMNAFRFAVEQKKSVATFRADDETDTSGNRLISEQTWAKTLSADPSDREADEQWLLQLSSSTSTERSGRVIAGMPKSLLD